MRVKPIKFVGHEIGPFDHIELNWKSDSRYTLISAQNGMGKTTLVTAISDCLSGSRHTSQGVRLSLSSHFERICRSSKSYAYFEFESGGSRVKNIQYPIKGDHGSDSYRREISSRIFDSATHQTLPHVNESENYYISSMPADTERPSWSNSETIDALAATYGVQRDLTKSRVKESLEIDSHPLDHVLTSSSIKSDEVLQWVFNQLTKRAFAMADDELEEAQKYSQAVRRIEKMFSDSLDLDIRFNVPRNPLGLEIYADDNKLDIDQLSHGTRSLMSWLLDYLQRADRASWKKPSDSALAPGIILIDEIDMHLHPEWQRKVMNAVGDLLPETYIIATTHSPFVLAGAKDAQIFEIYEGENGKLDVRSYNDLYGYPADLMLKKAFGMTSLYPPEIEAKMTRLDRLENKLLSGTITSIEQTEHDMLLTELAQVNPWLESLMAMQHAHD